jgi:hypothetical protein
MAAPGWAYFTDENTLGFGKLLRRSGRADVLYPGHEDLLARLDLVLVTRDRRIRTRPAELRAYWEFGIRSVWIGAKQDLGPRDQLDLFLAHEERLQREIVKRGTGPWALAMTPSGVRPLHLREP